MLQAYPTGAQSLFKMQNRAIDRQQHESNSQQARERMEANLTKAMPGYVERAISRVKAKGVRFDNVESAMARYLRDDRQYGLGIGRVACLDPQKTIGIATDYVFYVRPTGYLLPFELRGDMYWDLRTKDCEFWVDFSFNPSKAHPVGKYSCDSFVSGTADANFSSTFEAAVRQGFEPR